jgi:hypothetical protein
MATTLAEFRAKNLRLLERLCPDDPQYIKSWMKQFDAQHGIKSAVSSRPRARQDDAIMPKKLASGAKIRAS